MNEQLIHFVWQFRLFKNTYLRTVAGQDVDVIDPGLHNTNSGPDFFNAKIKIDNTLWAGNVEIHIDGRDWYQHKHHTDAAYNNVILHVVLHSAEKTVTVSGVDVPVVLMSVPENIIDRQNLLQAGGKDAPCYNSLDQMSTFEINAWLDRMLVERLEARSQIMESCLHELQGNWELLFFRVLARSFGLGINSDAFELWAKTIPLNVLKKHRNNIFQIEAICFGQAGFLEEIITEDNYQNALAKEYRFLKVKYQLVPIGKHLWRFLRLRPANFPTIRIAQLCGVIAKVDNLFAAFIRAKSLTQIQELFLIETSEYWQNHYTFGKISKKKSKFVGATSQNLIVLNAIVPMLFFYGSKQSDDDEKYKALELLADMKPEKNSIVSQWEEAGIIIENAQQTQALIHLQKNYCDLKKCLRCRIGHQVIAKQKHEAD